jgi:hypothetical protein
MQKSKKERMKERGMNTGQKEAGTKSKGSQVLVRNQKFIGVSHLWTYGLVYN